MSGCAEAVFLSITSLCVRVLPTASAMLHCVSVCRGCLK